MGSLGENLTYLHFCSNKKRKKSKLPKDLGDCNHYSTAVRFPLGYLNKIKNRMAPDCLSRIFPSIESLVFRAIHALKNHIFCKVSFIFFLYINKGGCKYGDGMNGNFCLCCWFLAFLRD